MASSDDGRLLIGSILGFGGGIYIFLKGFREYRKYRLVADTPAIRIRGAPMGFVQIRGEARGEETLVSPVTRTPCYLFKVVIEQWHNDSEGGGEWKHLATDIQNVKFDLQDASGNVQIDPAGAELDLPPNPVRELRGTGSGGPAFRGIAPSGAAMPESDLLQYVEQARVRHLTQMVGRGIEFVSHGSPSARAPQASPFFNMLADPFGSGAGGFRDQMVKAMLARRDPHGENSRLALEVWKYPQGTPEFDAALVRFGQAYGRVMARQLDLSPAGVLAQVKKQPQLLTMVAVVAGAAEPQADPENERARQVALAYARDQPGDGMRIQSHNTSGHFRLTEYCMLPGQIYDVTGTCAENPRPRDANDRSIIMKGTNEPTFLISSKGEKEVQSWLWKRSAWMVLGGAAVAVVCLAILLAKFGMF